MQAGSQGIGLESRFAFEGDNLAIGQYFMLPEQYEFLGYDPDSVLWDDHHSDDSKDISIANDEQNDPPLG